MAIALVLALVFLIPSGTIRSKGTNFQILTKLFNEIVFSVGAVGISFPESLLAVDSLLGTLLPISFGNGEQG